MEEENTQTTYGNFFEKNYKKLLIIPVALLIFAIVVLALHNASTGSFINRDFSLMGGVSLTIYSEKDVDINNLESSLNQQFPQADISVRKLADLSSGKNLGLIIEGTEIEEAELKPVLEEKLGLTLTEANYSVEEMGPALGASFYREMIYAILFSLLFMAIVVFITFRKLIPSLAVIFSAVLDLLVTLAIVNLFGIRLSTAGIAAFLMVLGYSIDTDILLTTRLLKRKTGTLIGRTRRAMKTGLTMTITTIVALTIGIIITTSTTIRQMFLIIVIALIVDLISTWIMNAGILFWYCKKKNIN